MRDSLNPISPLLISTHIVLIIDNHVRRVKETNTLSGFCITLVSFNSLFLNKMITFINTGRHFHFSITINKEQLNIYNNLIENH